MSIEKTQKSPLKSINFKSFYSDTTFKDDFLKFQDRILELDLKLAAILCQAFDDCHNLESVFKVSIQTCPMLL